MLKDSIDGILDASLGLQRIMRTRMIALEQEGVNLLQLHALLALKEHPSMTMKDFAKMLSITSPSATAFAQRLAQAGLVSRTHDKKNRRIVRLSITPRAKTMLKRLLERRNKIMKEIFSVIPPEDQRTFVRILRHVVSSHTSSSL